MKLEKLELYGFKSFADKTEFVFQPGLTAFVGPNGCGKSNVVDAVKWVLGEQSVKSLRGDQMLDVIFNGSPSRRSTGYAEATLTLTNAKGILPTDYETITVGRRLYRSGESEYYLNKQRCRLRDIRDLFMDTGIGMDAYSIVEQGKVDILLTANEQERRVIFEEAAGISKYKSQKKACLSKLERVDSNLQRLGDIIDEVEKRTRSVKYQAAKARRWKRLDDERRELAVALALHHYDGLVKDRERVRRELDRLNAEVGGLRAGLERTEAVLAELETAVIDADHAISALESEDVRITSRLQAAEDAVRMNEQRLRELDDLEESTKADIARNEATAALRREELERTSREAADLDRAVAEAKAALAERRAAVETLDNELRALRAEMEEERGRGLELASELARHNNELSAIGAQNTQLAQQKDRLARRAEEHRRGLAECHAKREELDGRTRDIAGAIAATENEKRGAEEEQGRLARDGSDLAEELHRKRSDIAGVTSRVDVLRDLEARNEGFGSGVRHLLEAREAGHDEVAGVCGVVADVIEVDVEHAAAVEAALGPHEQLVMTETFGAMTTAMDFLARAGKGQASFLALDILDGRTAATADPPEHPGILCKAMDAVRHDPKFEGPLRHLLGDVLVVRNIRAARELAEANGRDARYATLDGQLLNPRGVSVGGAARGASGVISRRSELRALDDAKAQLEGEAAELDKRRRENAGRSEETKRRIDQLAARLAESQTELAETQAQAVELDAAAKRFETELEAGRSEVAEIESHSRALAEREAAVRDEARRIEQAEKELRAALAQRERRLGESEATRDQMRREATELEVAQAQRAEKAEHLLRRTEELGRLIAEAEKTLEADRRQVTACIERRREADLTVGSKKAEIEDLLQRRGRLGSEKAEASNRREQVRVALDAKREERNATTRRAKETDARLNELNVHAAQTAMRIENLEARTESEQACSLAERYGQGEAPEADWTQVEQEIETLAQKMNSMGAVNAYAIEELEELERRAAELHQQRDDLRKAEQKLKEIIRKINRRSRELFSTTFENIRENFQGLFRKLFGGGRADIVLEPDVDILDAGIDVIACPPGKEPASITLLSGGEKTMTAIALLFAIFRSKPSPFCILDEVDAALDESNIDRFCALVREFLKESQFLIVTHSRRTMAMADALYGITMQEPGISTKVSVKFDDAVDVAAAG